MDKLEQLERLINAVDNQLSVKDFEEAFTIVIQVLSEYKDGLDAHISERVNTALSELSTSIRSLSKTSKQEHDKQVSSLKREVSTLLKHVNHAVETAEAAAIDARSITPELVDYSKVQALVDETIDDLVEEERVEKLEGRVLVLEDDVEDVKEDIEKLKKRQPNTVIVGGGGSSSSGGAVDSVNGETGVVTLTTDDISDSGQTNKWNQNHTGDVTGSTALTIDKTAITGKSTVTAVGADYVLISDTSDTGNLKKALVSDLTGSAAVPWGSITGTLSSQTDLQTALDAKVDENAPITGATKTKITYDTKGLVTSGADATTADIADSSNKRYVTDAQLTVIGNTSGTNTGDQTTIVGITGTKAQFDTAVTDGDFLFVGDITQYTDEMAQDAVGSILTDSAEIDFTYNDGAPSITASIVAGSIDETKLDASVNASLVLANNALPSSYLDTHVTLSANSDAKVPSQKAVKTYVDAVAQGLSIKESVRVATAAALPSNIYNNGASGVGATLTAVSVGVLTVDGVAVALNDRVLVKDEVATANNGIYLCTVAGTAGVAYVLTRSTSFDSGVEISGAFTFVEEGSTNADNGYVCTTNDPITVGTTGISFTQFSGAGQIVAGNALTKTGNTLDVAVDGTTIEVDSDALRRGALTGAITAPAGSNTTSLGSFTVAQLNTAISDGDVATGGGTATGTNTGDQTTIVGITGTKAQFDTAVTDGNFLFVGDITQYTDEMAQDAVGAMVDTTLEYVDATPLLRRAALTGDVTAPAGSNTTSIDKTAITGKTGATPVGADYIMFSDDSDGGNLKKALISDLPTGGGGGITIGTTTITSGTTTRILYNNAGVVGEYTLTGTGTVVAMQTAPTFVTSITTPSVLASSNDSGALGASGTAFSDLFLASGAVINFAAGNSVITHSSAVLEVTTGDLRVTTAGTNSASVVTVGGTQTLTNKTLTAPRFADLGFIADANGNELIILDTVTSAVNEITIANAATGTTGPLIIASGETNVDIRVSGKGTGKVHNITAEYGDINAASDGATVTFDLALANSHTVTLGGNRTLALSNAAVGQYFTLRLLQDGTGSRTVTWFSTIKWAGGVAPTLTTTASKADTLGFFCTSSGNYDGFVVGQNI